MTTAGQRDLAGVAHWDELWAAGSIQTPANPRDHTRGNLVKVRFDRLFRETFAVVETRGKALIEVGAARSVWLPYFAREFGFTVCGLDYSEIGCEQERQILARAGIDGRVVHGDLFMPPPDILGAFDVACSFGVVEHFRDTAAAVAAVARLVRPGGLVFTEVPNMAGACGWLARWLNRANFDVHVALDAGRLRAAHEAGGLEVVRSDYFLGHYIGIVPSPPADTSAGRMAARALRLANYADVLLRVAGDRTGLHLPATRWAAPYVVCIARVPAVS